jgi:hypothetical protein
MPSGVSASWRNVDELRQALDYPWDQWTVFLHPSQRQVVEQKFSGPARVSGSAGTGKTVVAIHRAANVLKAKPDARLLLTTFSLPLANALEGKLRILIGADKGIVPRVTFLSFRDVASELFTLAFGHHPRAATEEQIRGVLKTAATELKVTGFTPRFLMSEWLNVVDAWQVPDVRARAAVKAAGHTQLELSERREDPQGRVAIGTMHLAKGLEYKAIAVMACDDDVLPLQDRVEAVADESELDEVYETERHLFYVACTRARDQLLVSGVDPASEFFADLVQHGSHSS